MAKSIIEQEPDRCFECGQQGYLEEHHIFFGASRRRWSEKTGLKVKLCCRCHRDGKRGVHGQNRKLDQKLKKIGQRTYEEKYSREAFMRLFGKNYLDGEG